MTRHSLCRGKCIRRRTATRGQRPTAGGGAPRASTHACHPKIGLRGWDLTRSEVTKHDARAGSQRMMLRPYFFGLIAHTVTAPSGPRVTRNTTSSLRSHAIM